MIYPTVKQRGDILRALLQTTNYEIYYDFLTKKMVGLGGVEPPTSRLSGVRSNHLSYRPIFKNLCKKLPLSKPI